MRLPPSQLDEAVPPLRVPLGHQGLAPEFGFMAEGALGSDFALADRLIGRLLQAIESAEDALAEEGNPNVPRPGARGEPGGPFRDSSSSAADLSIVLLLAQAADSNCIPELSVAGEVGAALWPPFAFGTRGVSPVQRPVPLHVEHLDLGSGLEAQILQARMLDLAYCRRCESSSGRFQVLPATGQVAEHGEVDFGRTDFALRAVRSYLQCIARAEDAENWVETAAPESERRGLEQPIVQGWLLRASQLAIHAQLPEPVLDQLRLWLPRAAGATARREHPACSLRLAYTCHVLARPESRSLLEATVQAAERCSFRGQFAWSRALYRSAEALVGDQASFDERHLLAVDRSLTWAEEAQFRLGLGEPKWICSSMLDQCARELSREGAPPYAFHQLQQVRTRLLPLESAVECDAALVLVRDALLLRLGLLERTPVLHFLASLRLEAPEFARPQRSATRGASVDSGHDGGTFDVDVFLQGNGATLETTAVESQGKRQGTCDSACSAPNRAGDFGSEWYQAVCQLCEFVLEDLRLLIREDLASARTELALLVHPFQAQLGARAELLEAGVVACLQGDFRAGLAVLVPQLGHCLDQDVLWNGASRSLAIWLLRSADGPRLERRIASGDPELFAQSRAQGNLVLWLALRGLYERSQTLRLRSELFAWSSRDGAIRISK